MQYNEVMQNIYQAKGESLSEQYFDLGLLYKDSIQKSVKNLGKKRARLSVIRRNVAAKAWEIARASTQCREFCECLSAWAKGAEISNEQAMWMLADNLSGCQTMMIRYGSGVALLHTEEEFIDAEHIELHMKDPCTVMINEAGVPSYTLVYNNLMPGCGLYGFKHDVLIAIDTLFVTEDQVEQVQKPLLANMISWLMWRSKAEDLVPEKVVEMITSLGELVDGYAINVVYKVDKWVEGYKLILARSEATIERLGSQPGDYLRQTNLIDPAYPRMKWATPVKCIWRGGYRHFIERYKTLDKCAKLGAQYTHKCVNKSNLLQAHKMIQQFILIDQKNAFVNNDLGALCIGFLDNALTSVSCTRNFEKMSKFAYIVDLE